MLRIMELKIPTPLCLFSLRKYKRGDKRRRQRKKEGDDEQSGWGSDSINPSLVYYGY